MFEFRFAHPIMLVLLLLPVVLYILWRRGKWDWQPVPSALLYSDTRLLVDLTHSWRVWARRLPDILRAIAWVLMVLALARPQSGRAQEIIRGRGIDIVLVLDISGSMALPDFEPQNRFEAAKTILAEFIQGRQFDRIGLVVFAREAFHQSPPTLDYAVLLRLLQEVRLVTEIPGLVDGTAVGLGIVSAANMMRESTAASKVIILLTDGDNESGLDPVTAAQAVAVLGMRVYTIGMGRVESQNLDEEMLQKVAQAADGQYFRAQDLSGLKQVYERIDILEQSDVTRQVFVRWQDQAALLLWLSFGLLLLERLLRHTIFQVLP